MDVVLNAYSRLWNGGIPQVPEAWRILLQRQIESAFDARRHGKWPEWQSTLQQMPHLTASNVDLNDDVVTIGAPGDVDVATRRSIASLLLRLHPWRKGPFRVYGIEIDAEWRSDRKWRRLEDAIAPLRGRKVLDVGCGNGYYAWRMLGRGADLVIGIDPTLAHIVQFLALKHCAGDWPVYTLPLGIEDVPTDLCAFDTVFSMGILYHRRSPIDHLLDLRGCLRSGGELVLETLVIDGALGEVILPEDRYAQMRNVWFIPSCPTLISWLKRCGYRNIRVVDVTRTAVSEQRSTPWMCFQSLADSLDPKNPDLTREGLPAPQRAIVIAEKPR